MTQVSEPSHLVEQWPVPPPIIACRIRRAHRDDPREMAYLRSSLSEGVKASHSTLDDLRPAVERTAESPKLVPPMFKNMDWPVFKRKVRPILGRLLWSPDTQLLVADLDGAVAGWLAYSSGRSVDTVHWTHSRYAVRKRGVMRQLIDAAQLKHRIVYTLRGARQSHEWIVPWLASRGVTAAYQPLREWME